MDGSHSRCLLSSRRRRVRRPLRVALLHEGSVSESCLFRFALFSRDPLLPYGNYQAIRHAQQYSSVNFGRRLRIVDALTGQSASTETIRPVLQCAVGLLRLQFAHTGMYRLLYHGLSSACSFVEQSLALHHELLGGTPLSFHGNKF